MKERHIPGRASPKSPPASDLRVLVQRVLRGLADLMIDADLSMQEFEEISKRAYVAVASSRATRGNGTVNLSKVAAITGLNRAEVKSLVSEAQTSSHPGQKSRAARVVDGWTTDPLFSTRSGSARVLQFSDGPRSFSQLARRYAGDIPPRAILSRLERLGLVAVTLNPAKGRTRVHLIKKAPPRGPRSVANPIIQHLAAVLRNTNNGPPANVCSVRLPAADAPTLAAIARAAAERRDAFLSGLVSSFPATSGRQASIEVFVSISPQEEEAKWHTETQFSQHARKTKQKKQTR